MNLLTNNKGNNNYLKTKVSVGAKITTTSEITICTIEDVFDTIKNNSDLSEKIRKLRSISDEDLQKKYKTQNLPYFNLGLFENNIRRDENLISTSFMIIDVDKVSQEKLTEIKTKLDKDQKVFCYFLSPRGNGYKIIYRFSEEISDKNKYNYNYKYYAQKFGEEYEVKTDKTSDPSRACFFSSDPNLYLNENAEALEILDVGEIPTKRISLKKELNNPTVDFELYTHLEEVKRKTPLSEAVKPQDENNRHSNMIVAVGHFISMGMDDETIMSLALALNNYNNPPKPESEIRSDIGRLIKNSKNFEGEFWKLNRNKFKVLPLKYIGYLYTQGFAKVYYDKSYIIIRKKDNIAQEILNAHVNDFLKEYIKSLKGNLETYKEIIGEELIGRSGRYCGDTMLANLDPITLKIKHGDSQTGFIYFKNSYVVAKRNSELITNPYSTLEAPIWKTSMIERDFRVIPIKYRQSEFEQFIRNVVRGDETRFLSLCSAIGYLLHGYKDQANAKAIIIVDEKISENPEGGSGKSLLGNAISKMKKSARIDGKNFEFNSRFTFQDVEVSTEILEFNDAEKSFNFEKLFSIITDDMKLEYKSEKPIRLPFSESPKILISTNYTITGSGNSNERRMFEIEFSDYYNAKHTPLHEFGHNFFDDWDEAEWNRFDNFMLECLMLYLDEGLIPYKKINLERRKLLEDTSSEFVDYMETHFIYDFEKDKETLFVQFKRLIGYENDFLNKCPIKKNTFTKWLKQYSKSLNKKYDERASNGTTFVKITN